MKLENQVVSLELAKRLKKLGMKQESLFGWYRNSVLPNDEELEVRSADNGIGIAAFTVAELGEMLPPRIEVDGEIHWLELVKNGPEPKVGKVWDVFYAVPSEGGGFANVLGEFASDTEADARAKMLIYLIENNLIDIRTLLLNNE